MHANNRRSSPLGAILIAAALNLTLTAAGVVARAAQPGALELTSPSFQSNGDIPARFTCEGADVSPLLHWTDPPAGTRSFALILYDPDAPGGDFTHWVLYDLPAGARKLPEALPASGEVRGARQGRNSFGKLGYGGPCPPPGAPHRYIFKLYAVDRRLELPAGASRSAVEKALGGHVLGRAELAGRFKR